MTIRHDTGTGLLEVSTTDGVAEFVLNDPARRNALSFEMVRPVPRLLASMQADPAVRCVIISGAGGSAFTSGANIAELAQDAADAAAGSPRLRAMEEFWSAWDNFGKPVIAAIDGFCLGGGMSLALRADIRWCSDHSVFGIPAVKIGRGYALEAIGRVLDTVGPGWASEILLSGRRFTAMEALQAGIVTQIQPPQDLYRKARQLADEISANAPLAVAAAKAAIRVLTGPATDPERDEVARRIADCQNSEDYREGRQAFLERRPARFSGN